MYFKLNQFWFQASDYVDGNLDHLWRTSEIATFATNIEILLLQCDTGGMANHDKYCIITKIILEYQVMMFHDEKVVETQPACGQMLCSLDQFRQAYQYLADLDFEEECKI